MATLYWGGGSGTWSTTDQSHWYNSSSLTALANAVPGPTDSVVFDAAGTYTVTLTGALTCNDISVSAGVVTFADGTSPTLTISGSMTLIAATVWSSVGLITFNATTTGKTIMTNNVSINASVYLNGAGGGWTLGYAFTTTKPFSVYQGTFNTNNYNMTIGGFNSNASTARTINLGSSTITITTSGSSLFFAANGSTPTNLTFNAGTSTIIFNSTDISGLYGGVTFYNVTYSGKHTFEIYNENTFNNLSVAANGYAGAVTSVKFAANQTINGALSTTSTAGNRRVFFSSYYSGITVYGKKSYKLTINGTPSLTDADFADLYIVGTAAPISGTRIGNRSRVSGVTFTPAKTVYWNYVGNNDWSGTGWCTSNDNGLTFNAASNDNFPLAQDTAVFNNNGSVGTIMVDSDWAAANSFYLPSVDMSARTSAMTLAFGATNYTIYGDWKNGSGTTITGSIANLYFTGDFGATKKITSAGIAFPFNVHVDFVNVELVDAISLNSKTLHIRSGTFDTKGYNVTLLSINASNSTAPYTINFNNSTVTLTGGGYAFSVNANSNRGQYFNAGTSTVQFPYDWPLNAGGISTNGNLQFYNVKNSRYLVSSGASGGRTLTFNNLTYDLSIGTSLFDVNINADIIVNGSLSASTTTATSRIMFYSVTPGTTQTLTCASISLPDCDFRDIKLAGAAINSAPTRAGNCGGNSGIDFSLSPAKTVYWNLAGTQNWSATGWASTSGGTPAVDNFPLAQDTVVFNNTGSADTVTIDKAWNIGTVDMSARTTAMTLQLSNSPHVYGNWKNGSGTTLSNNLYTLNFSGRGTQTITSAGKSFYYNIRIYNFGGTVQLADSLTTSKVIELYSGTFDAANYNVTTSAFFTSAIHQKNQKTLKMGSGTWTLTGTSGVWYGPSGNQYEHLDCGTSNIVLSDTSTNARSFYGYGLYYPKITIGGSTGTSTTTFLNLVVGELASTKTVAHTIAFSTSIPKIYKWSVTGTSGNLVTVSSTLPISISGSRVSGVDYLAMGTTSLYSLSPAEFYAGANSTGTGSGIILTAAPTATTRYWVGGSGTWDTTTTTNWSSTPGGSGGASVPTSADNVIFDRTGTYTVTMTGNLRCKDFSVTAGAVTFANGTDPTINIGGSLALIAGGTWSSIGALTFNATTTGKTIKTAGVYINGQITFDGVGGGWTLSDSLSLGSGQSINVYGGTFNSGNQTITCYSMNFNNYPTRSVSLGSSTINLSAGLTVSDSTYQSLIYPLTFNAGTSQINFASIISLNFYTGGKTFYNVTFSNSNQKIIYNDGATFNNLTISNPAASGVVDMSFGANVTITGTLTVSGSSPSKRIFFNGYPLGTQRTLTCGAVSISDCDFRDIKLAGAAAPATITRAGNCGGNDETSIIFPAAKTVYWNLAGAQNWYSNGWCTSNDNGATFNTADPNNFPLAQDTAVFNNNGGITSIATSYIWNIGTVDMSARSSAMSFNFSNYSNIYGDFKIGSGTAISATYAITFVGRGTTQTLTSNGKSFACTMYCNNIGGSLKFADAFTNSSTLICGYGTIDFNNVTVTVNSLNIFGSANQIFAFRDNSHLIVTGTASLQSSNVSVTGKGTISMTSASAKTFGVSGLYAPGITLNNAGIGTLTIADNNATYYSITLNTITNTVYPSTISFQNILTATLSSLNNCGGVDGNLTKIISGTDSATNTYLLIDSGTVSLDYISLTNVLARGGATFYAGANSTNNGGNSNWLFSKSPVANLGNFFSLLMIKLDS